MKIHFCRHIFLVLSTTCHLDMISSHDRKVRCKSDIYYDTSDRQYSRKLCHRKSLLMGISICRHLLSFFLFEVNYCRKSDIDLELSNSCNRICKACIYFVGCQDNVFLRRRRTRFEGQLLSIVQCHKLNKRKCLVFQSY